MSRSLVPHFQVPLQLRGGSFATHEQDTLDEIAQCVQVLLSTTEGQRVELPDYGIPDLAFVTDIPIVDIENRIEEWEPRALSVLSEGVDDADELIRKLIAQVSA